MASRFVQRQDAMRSKGESESNESQHTPSLADLSDRRSMAARLKVTTLEKEKRPNNSAPIHHAPKPPSHHNYQSRQAGGQNIDQNHDQHENAQLQRKQFASGEAFMDDSVPENFDVTKSTVMDEVHFGEQPYRRNVEAEEYAGDEAAHSRHLTAPNTNEFSFKVHGSPQLHHKPNMPHLKQNEHDLGSQQNHSAAVNSRFVTGQQSTSYPAMQIRAVNGETMPAKRIKSSKKRSRRAEYLRDVENHESAPFYHGEEGDDTIHDNLGIEDSRNPMVDDRARFQEDNDIEISGGSETSFPPSTEGPSPSPDGATPPLHGQNRLVADSDYSIAELKDMDYAALKSESWQKGPYSRSGELPQELLATDASLEQRIQYLISLRGSNETSTVFDFFERMPTDDWHEAGEIILSKMNDLMKKISEARENKRKIAAKYEAICEERVQTIRSKSENLDTKLKEMKVKGEGVLSS